LRLHRRDVVDWLEMEQIPKHGAIIFATRQQERWIRGTPGHG
jgi:hypothetical protein